MALPQVFLSSTYFDMKDAYRPAAMQAIKRAGAAPIIMETFGANPERVDHLSVKEVDASDVFVLLVGFRYGTLMAGHQKSITELEYEEALQLQLPVLAYLAKDTPDVVDRVRQTFPTSALDATSAAPDQQHRLSAFRTRLRQTHAPEYFVSPSDLAAKIERDVARVLSGGNITGAKQLKLGYDALLRDDYGAAQFALQSAVLNLREDATMYSSQAARARFLLALAQLVGRRPAVVPLQLARQVLDLLSTAMRLNPLGSYRLAFAVIALDVSRNGLPQFAQEADDQLDRAAASTMTMEDQRNIALLQHCQSALMRDVGL